MTRNRRNYAVLKNIIFIERDLFQRNWFPRPIIPSIQGIIAWKKLERNSFYIRIHNVHISEKTLLPLSSLENVNEFKQRKHLWRGKEDNEEELIIILIKWKKKKQHRWRLRCAISRANSNIFTPLYIFCITYNKIKYGSVAYLFAILCKIKANKYDVKLFNICSSNSLALFPRYVWYSSVLHAF